MALQEDHWPSRHAARSPSASNSKPPSHIHPDRQHTSLDILLKFEAQRAPRVINERGPRPGPIVASDT